MFRLGLAVSLSISVLAIAQSTQPTTRPVDKAAVAQLVGQLGDDDAGVRSAARDKLAGMGPAISSELQTAMGATKDPEVRSTLESLVTDLAKADKSKPTLVTMKLHGTTAKAAVDELTKQTGVEIGTWPDWVWRESKGTVTLEAENQPFWVVLNDICEQGGLSPQNGHLGAGKIVLSNAGQAKHKRPTFFREGFLFVAQSVNRNHSIDYADPQRRDSNFNISMNCFVDPKLNVVRGPSQLHAVEAIDDKGNTLSVGDRGDSDLRASPWGSNWNWDFSIPLKYRPDQGTVLKTLKGTASFEMANDVDAWEIDLQKFERSEHAYPGGKYSVEAFSDKPGVSAKITITYKEPGMFRRGGNPFENPYVDTNSVRNMMKLVDDKGHSYGAQGMGGGGGGGKVSYDVNFDIRRDQGPPPKLVKLIWSIPKAFKQIDVPVEFKDLPIP